jgi:hypothetical protein
VKIFPPSLEEFTATTSQTTDENESQEAKKDEDETLESKDNERETARK